MTKLILTLFIAFSALVSFTAGAHAVDLCQDHVTYGDGAHAQHDSGVPHDCSCPAHHNHCSHHPMQGPRSVPFSGPADSGSSYLSANAQGIPSPFLEKPSQPPKI